ncbi:hypothetical protein [Xenorhabdus littoralis]|uniref:hypothetical protein n=1 Tax=Xenorhabdus littoralis TaxID=2582835 RepID=UPI0029E7F48A|nr:hypothetical protein [Xenorhabdus sp. psl]MDX7990289.1 hypothetical protein [Xenorhabdus sp. psl]
MKVLTDFEKISGYLTILEEQQAIVTDMITEMADAKNTAFDAILDAKASLDMATHALKKQLAELDHIEAQKAHMHQVLSELDIIKQSTLCSLDESTRKFTALAQTVPNQINQNVMEILQHIDIAGAVRQRTDAQMEAIATQVKALSDRSLGFVDEITKAENDLRLRYQQLKSNFWWVVGGAVLSIVIVTGVSARFFFSESVDRNYDAIVHTYKKTVQFEEQVKALESKIDKALNNAEKPKKK